MELNEQMKYKLGLSGITYIIVFISFILFLGASYDEIVNDKNKQLDFVQKQINDSKQVIAGNSDLLSGISSSIDSINVSLNSINDFLKDYQNETYLTPDQIASETNQVITLEQDVGKIQTSFRNKIVSMYKHGKDYELELLLSSKTPNEFLRRNQYLQKFAQSRKKELRDLRSKKYILGEKKKMLSLSVSLRRVYVESKRNEKVLLEDKLKTLTAKKNQVDFTTNSYNSKIERLESEQTNIKNFLANLSDNRQNYKDTKISRLPYLTDNLDSLKGTLNSPLDISLIRREFGTNINNAANTAAFNYGVDFSISYGSRVYAAASGTVTVVGDVPFYGKAIVVDNGNGYRTVYACLSDVSVRAGDKIKLNQVLAKSGYDLDGQGLHFEIWKGKIPLNPREWIRM